MNMKRMLNWGVHLFLANLIVFALWAVFLAAAGEGATATVIAGLTDVMILAALAAIWPREYFTRWILGWALFTLVIWLITPALLETLIATFVVSIMAMTIGGLGLLIERDSSVIRE